MNTIELRNYIINKLNQINDIKILNALKTIVDSTAEDLSVYSLTDEEKAILKDRQIQARNGEAIDSEEVFKEIESWLDGK
ncbi:MAG: hypothetical protein C0594_06200 [Marinilabiliales bacterium]|nr:MAG: hypothetical protein C0594_06200 [Marinilabiliales bacterium]